MSKLMYIATVIPSTKIPPQHEIFKAARSLSYEYEYEYGKNIKIHVHSEQL